ncbi:MULTISPECIES: hypothetical protein [Halobacteriovorax]|uniref:FAD assembly factor SdhE n=1 Tax=Halobacteriovorax vibrionivorans TaxID=2152716 RepID=A0ABY0IBY4_9BACT|nr:MULTISPECIES: hypothetical protein [Halobacteriovorax]RZF20471.1 hypothetical protein DAY19_10810 [Halobacteriovorax vibrionivorans]TGD48836.1 hypothetical protein EP118_02245 [Halobacteriovorax sp. Y22]
MKDKVIIEFSKEEALVLFEYLARVNNDDALENTFLDESEKRVIWNLEASFEEKLVEPFKSDYNMILKRARSKILSKISND